MTRQLSAVAAGLLVGVLADARLGDPRSWHPVAGFGRAAQLLEKRLYRDTRASGALFTLLSTAPVVLASAAVERRISGHRWSQAGVAALGCWLVVGGRSLRSEATRLAGHLERGDLGAARAALPALCGRSPDGLDSDGLARAAVESVAENTSDAVVAPLLWGALAGLPGLIGYRAVNTLDAMVGHRSARYARFGTASARLDDALNWLPARLTGLLTLLAGPVVGGSPSRGWRAWRRDASAHPSPNAGVCEATVAGVLGVQLGGRTRYGSRVEQRPLLGDGPAPGPADVARAVRLSRAVEVGAVAVCVVLAGAAR